MIPVNHLPMTRPLRYLGWPDAKVVDQIDTILRPQIDAAHPHNDNPLNVPIAVDPVKSMDPLAIVDPGMRASIENAFAQVRALLPAPPASPARWDDFTRPSSKHLRWRPPRLEAG